MAKTYTAAGSATAGDVYTASAHNVIVTDVNNFIVPPMCTVQRLSAQSITNGTWNFVSFTSELIDTDGMFTATDTKITIQTAGVYILTANTFWASNATGLRVTMIHKNSGSTPGGGTTLQRSYVAAASADITVYTTSVMANLAASDTVHMSLYQTISGGGSLNSGASDADSNSLSAVWVGRTS